MGKGDRKMETKYTKDGKKVVVIGKLNDQQTIVQEIFIVNGCEVPGGENFVVKGLLDNPGVSWKEKKIADIEKNYDVKITEYERKMKKLREKERVYMEGLNNKILQMSSFIDNASAEAFNMVSDLMLGKYKYYINSKYEPDINDFTIEDSARDDDVWSYVKNEGIKLISLFGKSDGDLHFRINKYRDGSGGWDYLYLFKTLEEAKIKCFELIDEDKYLTETDIEIMDKWGITPNPEKLEAYWNKKRDAVEKEIDRLEADIEKAKLKMVEIPELIRLEKKEV